MASGSSGGGGGPSDDDMHLFVELILSELKTFSNNNMQIVVAANGDDRLSQTLYNNDFKCITNVHNDKSLMQKNILKHYKDRPIMIWRTIDITKLTEPAPPSNTPLIRGKSMHAVIDMGALDKLSKSDMAEYLKEVSVALRVGGKFICITSLTAEARDCVIGGFRFGYKMDIRRLQSSEKFIVVVEFSSERFMPFPITSNLAEGTEHLNAIKTENRQKEEHLERLENDFLLTTEDLMIGVKGNVKNFVKGRKYKFSWTGDFAKYKILMLDVDAIPSTSYQSHVIFIREQYLERERWPEIIDLPWYDNDESILKKFTATRRVYMVFIGQEAHNIRNGDIQDDLFDLSKAFAFDGTDHWVPCFNWFTTKGVEEFIEICTRKAPQRADVPSPEETPIDVESSIPCEQTVIADVSSPEETPIDVESSIPREHTVIADVTSPEETPIDVESSIPREYTVIDVESIDDFAIPYEEIDIPSQFTPSEEPSPPEELVGIEYPITLTRWLEINSTRWSAQHENWNLNSFLVSCKLDNVPQWNASRPIDECAQVICGLLKAVREYHRSGRIHGHLDKTDNYLLTPRVEKRGGFEKFLMDVELVCEDTREDNTRPGVCKAVETDLMHLASIIFIGILENKDLPRIWKDLHAKVMRLANEKDLKGMSACELEKQWDLILDHPAHWTWRERKGFIEKLWMETHEVHPSQVKSVLVKAITKAVDKKSNWDFIPKETPLRRVLDVGAHSLDAMNQFRYVRSLLLHLTDRKRNGQWKYIRKGEEAYANDEFVEVCTCEIFPNMLLKILENLPERS